MDLTGIGSIADLAGKILDKVIPDPVKAMEAKTELLKLQQSGELAALASETDLLKGQLAVNQAEAGSASLFVSGWRPAVGWVCAFSLLYVAILEPMARFAAMVWIKYAGPFPVIDTTVTFQLLFGMLGIAGMRSFEKVKGVTK